MKLLVLVAAGEAETILALVVVVRIAERRCCVACEVRLRAESGVVVQPVVLDGFIVEIGRLPAYSLLLAIGAIERIDAGEELHGVRLGYVPRRVSEDGVEAGSRFPENVGELQFPVKEAHVGGYLCCHPACVVRWDASVVGSGAQEISSAGQNQQEHHRSIASLRDRQAAEPSKSSR